MALGMRLSRFGVPVGYHPWGDRPRSCPGLGLAGAASPGSPTSSLLRALSPSSVVEPVTALLVGCTSTLPLDWSGVLVGFASILPYLQITPSSVGLASSCGVC